MVGIPNPESIHPPEGSPELKASFASFPSEREGATGCEDTILADREHGVFAVFDGVGGEASGEVASQRAAAVVKENLQEAESPSAVETAILQANKAVHKKGQEDPKLRGMATTASVVKIRQTSEGGREALIGNVGDSRVYLYRNGELRQLTLDDTSYMAEFRDPAEARDRQERLNRIENEKDVLALGFESVPDYYRKNRAITNALGVERLEIEPRTLTQELQPRDRILITSDGVHDNLTTAEMERVLGESGNAEALARAALARSRDREHIRHKADDITAVLVELPS